VTKTIGFCENSDSIFYKESLMRQKYKTTGNLAKLLAKRSDYFEKVCILS
jgi:hypothetical protein